MGIGHFRRQTTALSINCICSDYSFSTLKPIHSDDVTCSFSSPICSVYFVPTEGKPELVAAQLLRYGTLCSGNTDMHELCSESVTLGGKRGASALWGTLLHSGHITTLEYIIMD